MPASLPALGRVTRRADYLAANRGLRAPMPGFVLLVRPRGDGNAAIRIGITVSRKVGGAVVRNRMKRRFRELARDILPASGLPGADHILIGRPDGVEREWGLLRTEFEKALRKLRAKILPGTGRGTMRSMVEGGERSEHGADGEVGPLGLASGEPPPRAGEDSA